MLHLDVAADRPDAFVAVTLSEVLPDGAATRISYGLLNLTHRDGHEDLKPLEPGRRYKVRIQLNECGQRIGAGNRLRLAISSAYWPIVWPSPAKVTLSVTTGTSALELPVRKAEGDPPLADFGPAEGAPPMRTRQLRPGERKIELRKDVLTTELTVERWQDDGLIHIEDFDWDTRTAARRFYSIRPDDPLSAEARTHWQKEYGRGDFRIHIETRTHMSVTPTEFLLDATLDAYEGEARVFSKEWRCRVPRDHA